MPAATGENRGWGSPILDPRVIAAFAFRTQFGSTFPAFIEAPRFNREGTMPVVVRFVRTPSAALLAELGALDGMRWGRDARPVASGAYLAHVTESAAIALAARPEVGRVECDLFPRGPLPLDQSQTETRVDAARRAILIRDGVDLDGRGVVIGDIDTSVHLFHPAFFNADGGYFAWRDANGNGTFEPGTDGGDLNGDGMFQPDEKLSLLSATTHDSRLQRINPSTTFRPDYDWLYIDANDNMRRDFGADFSEDTPAYGEPLFVADDANHNGTLDPTERLIRLKTSKFRAINSDHDYLRGDGENPLVQYADAADMEAFSRNLHATGVNGILVGGVPGVSRLLGLAPRAEIVLSDYYGLGMNRDDGLVAAMQWVIDHGANVLVTEFAPYAGVTLDGSSEGEQLLDSFSAMGGVPVSPAGNLAIGHKHVHATLNAGMNTISLQTDGAFAGSRFAQISIHHRMAGRRIIMTIGIPGSAPMELPEDAPRGIMLPNGIAAQITNSASSRGTQQVFLSLFSRQPLPEGNWTFAVNVMGGPIEADLYAGDDKNSWAGGFGFAGNDESRTLCYPSTSDDTLTVAAYTLHGGAAFAASSMAGQLAGYSSRGPRLDGIPGIDIAAPDNPMSALSMFSPRIGPAAYTPFGGTSGAGPHVAAAAALLRQINPMAAPGAIRTMLLDHTRNDMFAPANGNAANTGKGKLDVAAALGLTATEGMPPTLTLRAPAHMAPMATARLDLTVMDDGAASDLRMRWDTNYDGTPDTDWLPIAPYNVQGPASGTLNVRVEVRDSQGYRVGATAAIAVVSTMELTPEDRMFDPNYMPPGCHCRTSVVTYDRSANSNLRYFGFAAISALLLLSRRRHRFA